MDNWIIPEMKVCPLFFFFFFEYSASLWNLLHYGRKWVSMSFHVDFTGADLPFLVLRQGWIHQNKFQHGWVRANGGPGNGADGSWIVHGMKGWGGRFTTGCVSLFRLNYPLISPLLCSARREMAFCRPLALKEQGRVGWRIQHRPALPPCRPNGLHYEA